MSDTTAPQADAEKRALGDDHSDSSAQRSDPEKHALADKNNFDSEKHVVGDADASVKSIIEERAAQDGTSTYTAFTRFNIQKGVRGKSFHAY